MHEDIGDECRKELKSNGSRFGYTISFTGTDMIMMPSLSSETVEEITLPGYSRLLILKYVSTPIMQAPHMHISLTV